MAAKRKVRTKFVISSDESGEFYWIFFAANGEEIARSSESYVNLEDCHHSIELVRLAARWSKVIEKL